MSRLLKKMGFLPGQLASLHLPAVIHDTRDNSMTHTKLFSVHLEPYLPNFNSELSEHIHSLPNKMNRLKKKR